MGKNKCKCPDGIPEWVVTYGDLMSLLLTFFILLVSFSEMKKDEEYQRVVTAVKEAFGYSGGVGVLPVDDPPLRSMIQSLEAMAQKNREKTKVSHTNVEAMDGLNMTVKRVQEGTMFTIGGHMTFEPGSAVLMDGAKGQLLKIAKMLRGRRNVIAIRGHTASKTLPADCLFKDLRDLSYFRAKSVKTFMVEEGELDPKMLSVDARADNEPLSPRTYTPESQIANRRVEIILTESVVDELHPDANYADPNVARGQ